MTNQKVNKSDNVIQVAGNVEVKNQYGLAVHEVRELAQLFMRENLPVLRAEALKVAEENVQNFLGTFEEELAKKIEKIDPNKFKDPDVQASMNDAVIEVAKKGNRSNAEILCDLIIERASAKTDDYISLVAGEAIKIVPRLTSHQIGFLTLVVFLRHMRDPKAAKINDIEPLAKAVLEISQQSIGLSESQKSHLQFAGCLSILQLVTNTAYAIWKAEYPFLKDVPDNQLKQTIEHECPNLHILAQAFEDNKLAQISLTSVGQLIGLSNLSKRLGSLNYANWIN